MVKNLIPNSMDNVWKFIMYVFLLGLISTRGWGYVQNSTLHAGASVSNITPVLGEAIAGGWDAPPTFYVHDQLQAKTLILFDGNIHLVFVIVDNVSINREVYDAAKAKIENKLGIPKEHVLMASTHTHSAPNADKPGKRNGWSIGEPLEGYQKLVADKIADGVRVAYVNLEPAKIAIGSVDIPDHVFNRRWIMKEAVRNPFGGWDQVQMNPGSNNENKLKPAGPTDPELSFIAVESINGRPIAVLGNYSLHYVGGVPQGHLSADYFGLFGKKIEVLLSAFDQYPPFVGIMTNGTSADVSNNNYAIQRTTSPPYEKMKEVSSDIAQKMYKVYQQLNFQSSVELGAMQSEIYLGIRRMDNRMKQWMEEVENKPSNSKPIYHQKEDTFVGRVKQLEKEWPDTIAVLTQSFKIGELGIAAVPFEMFAESGLEIKESSPYENTFTIGLANGGYGYLPTPKQHKLGGYETWLTINRVEPLASDILIQNLIEMITQLKGN